MESRGGHLFVHAFMSGAWAVTRGQPRVSERYSILTRSVDDDQQEAEDLDGAMKLGIEAAKAIADGERADKNNPAA